MINLGEKFYMFVAEAALLLIGCYGLICFRLQGKGDGKHFTALL